MNNRKLKTRIMLFIFMFIIFLPACNTANQELTSGPGDNLPQAWSSDKNVRWKFDLPGRGWSSPVISDNKVFITTAINVTKPPVKEEEKPDTPNSAHSPSVCPGKTSGSKATGSTARGHNLQIRTLEDGGHLS